MSDLERALSLLAHQTGRQTNQLTGGRSDANLVKAATLKLVSVRTDQRLKELVVEDGIGDGPH